MPLGHPCFAPAGPTWPPKPFIIELWKPLFGRLFAEAFSVSSSSEKIYSVLCFSKELLISRTPFRPVNNGTECTSAIAASNITTCCLPRQMLTEFLQKVIPKPCIFESKSSPQTKLFLTLLLEPQNSRFWTPNSRVTSKELPVPGQAPGCQRPVVAFLAPLPPDPRREKPKREPNPKGFLGKT